MILLSDNGIVHLVSPRAVDDVLEKLLSILRTKAITVFAIVDLQMPATKLGIFGNPKAGTPVMIAAPDAALDLPLKILIAEGPNGSTRVSYNSVAYLLARYELTPDIAANVAAIEQLAAAIIA